MSEDYTSQPENTVEDLSSIENDIDKIANKFIAPIDNLRSSTIKPNINLEEIEQTNANGKKQTLTQAILNLTEIAVDPDGKNIESRAHTFYRMIGLPVMDADGWFFNPGFDPNISSSDINHIAITQNIDPKVAQLQNLRESEFKNRVAFFDRQDENSIVYALSLSLIPEFSKITESDNPFESDYQTFTVIDRGIQFGSFTDLFGVSIQNVYSEGTHILKPFMVDPIIASTVRPGTKSICVPFLKGKDDTRYERDTFLSRPIIENILINRLTDPTEQVNLVNTLLNPDTSNNTQITQEDLTAIVQALMGNSTALNANNLVTATGGPSLTSLTNISRLIRQLKVILELLREAIQDVNKVSKNINWFPVPAKAGPEFGSEQGNFITPSSNKELDNNIAKLKTNRLAAQFSTDQAPPDKGSYIGVFFEAPKNTHEDSLDDLQAKRNTFINIGSKALRTIELVTGEISGLGLVDIIAIYTALWAMDLNALVALIDDDAFNRVKLYYSDLLTADTFARVNNLSPPSAKTALSQLESKINNILRFADFCFANDLKAPDVAEPGTP